LEKDSSVWRATGGPPGTGGEREARSVAEGNAAAMRGRRRRTGSAPVRTPQVRRRRKDNLLFWDPASQKKKVKLGEGESRPLGPFQHYGGDVDPYDGGKIRR